MVNHAKWCMNVKRWRPTREQWLHLTSSIDENEVYRINKFKYEEDSKSSLVGQALIRKFLSEATRRPSNETILTRSAHGRPIVHPDYVNGCGETWPKLLDFNVSHSGDYCVFAGCWSDEADCPVDMTVGVDVTKIIKKDTRQDLDRFLDLMSRREFTRSEWSTVERVQSERQKCINFTRLWCLKESFIKSIGLGLSFKLDRISFHPENINITTEFLQQGIVGGTTVKLDGRTATDWHFQETALDEEHMVAIGYHSPTSGSATSSYLDGRLFLELAVESLVSALTPIKVADEENWDRFRHLDTKIR